MTFLAFSGGLTSTLNGTLLFSAAFAMIYTFLTNHPPSYARTVSKVMSTALLTVIAWMAGGPVLLLVALALSVVGDLFLALRGDNTFLVGLGGFLLAQVAYTFLFVPFLHTPPYPLGLTGTIVVALAVAAFMVAVTRALIPALGANMRLPIAVYIGAIFCMALAAVVFNSLTIAAGACLFVVSDALIAIERFLMGPGSAHRSWTGPVIWVTYYLAQVLLLLGVLSR